IAFRLASLVQLPIYGFQTAWGPYVYSTIAEGGDPKIFNVVLKGYCFLLVFFALFTKIFERELVIIFSDEAYLNSAPFIILILLALIIESLSWITGIGI